MARNKTAAFWIILLNGLTVATAQVLLENMNATCHDYGTSVTCPGLVESFDEKTGVCDGGLMKLNIKVLEVNRGQTGNCAKVTYSITCSSHEDKQLSRAKQEICRLVQMNMTKDGQPLLTPFNLSASNGHSFLENEHGVRISVDPRSEDLRYMIATVRSQGITPSLLDEDGTRAANYDQFYVPEDSVVTVLSVYNENATEAGVVFNMSIPMSKHPLSQLAFSARILAVERKCAFWNETRNLWDDSACETVTSSSHQTVCTCDHNSAFVVVFAVQEVEIAPELMWASTGLEIASMLFLVMAIVLLIVYREKMRNFDRVLVQINLCLALMLAHLFFVISPAAAVHELPCKAVTVGAHYFLVATSVLMMMEGALMLMKILAPNRFNDSTTARRRRVVGFFIAWVLPAIYVIVCSTIGFLNDAKVTTQEDDYVRFWVERGGYDYCWINPKYNAVVVAPIGLLLAINLVVAIKLGTIVWKMSKNAEAFKPTHIRDVNKASHAGKALRAILILMPILGIPWIIGFLVNMPKPFAMIFATMHVIVNSLQGVLLFLHYVPFNSEMRTCVKRSWKNTVTSIASATPTIHFTNNRSDSGVGLRDD